MALPHDQTIQIELLELLAAQPEGKMHCNDVYKVLAKRFPKLTERELTEPYQTSQSHWANRVQFAVMHLKEQGLMLHHTMAGGIGIWGISEKGRKHIKKLEKACEDLLKDLGS